jgi:hypothetical protein
MATLIVVAFREVVWVCPLPGDYGTSRWQLSRQAKRFLMRPEGPPMTAFDDRLCEGFRMTAAAPDASPRWAVIRIPS